MVLLLLSFPGLAAAAPVYPGSSPVLTPAPGPLEQGSSAATALAQAQAALPPSPASATIGGCTGVHPSQYLELNPTERALVQRCAYLEMRASQAAAGWVLATGNPPAFYLYDFILTFDSTDGYVLLFGAPVMESPNASAQTWAYRGGNWTELHPGGSPLACVGAASADDPADGYVVYVVGTTRADGSACPGAGETWGFHAGGWTQFTTATAPSARAGESFTNDSADGYLVLFGGISSACSGAGNVCNDTWTFSAGSWTELHLSVAPSNRSSAGMTYDAGDGYLLLYGGEGPNGTVYTMLNDTWSFSAGKWTPIATSQSPPQPQPDGLTYDYGDGYAFYTQVCANITNTARSEVTWKYSAGNWSAIAGGCSWNSTAPAQRLGEGTTYDPVDGYVVFFGGGGIYFAPAFHDTWTFRGGSWTDRTVPGISFLPTSGEASVTYDAADQAVLLFGGYNYSGQINSTWEYASGTWTQLHPAHAPSARGAASMVYDALDGYVLLFGGYTTSGPANDTWEFVGGNWTQLTPSTSPPPLVPAGMVYDGADGYVLLYTGEGYADTWNFHAGVWTNITSTAGPGPGKYALTNNLAYDATDGYVVQYGQWQPSGGSSGYWTSNTWEFLKGSWTNITASVTGTPPLAQSDGFAGMGPTGGVLLFGGWCVTCTSSTVLGGTWVYSGLTWGEQYLASSPSPRYNLYLVYDDAIEAGVLFGGENATSYNTALGDLWLWEAGAAPSPFVTAFVASPSTVDEGIATSFNVTVVGGTPPLSFGYTGLPTGCSSANTSSLRCVPASRSAGNYTIGVTVTDVLGNLSTAYTGLEVNPRPSVASFAAVPSVVTLGSRTILSVSAVNGTPPYSYHFVGLPAGCSTQTIPSLPCTPTASGNFTPSVTAYDADGVGANATTALRVTPLTDGALTLDAFTADPAAFILGNSTELNASASSSAGPVTFRYSDLPPGCVTGNLSSLACAPTAPGVFAPSVNVSDPAGDFLTLSTPLVVYPSGGGGVLSLEAYGASPALFTVGGSTVLYVNVAGARGVLTYAYYGLPEGCFSQNVSALPCTPIAVGSFSVSILVTDSAGGSVDASFALTVLPQPRATPPLTIRAFNVTPAIVAVGGAVTLWVDVTGGLTPYSYAYVGLPSGCAGGNVSSWSCHPESAGTFGVVVTVTDAAGNRTASNVTLRVTAPALPPPASVASGGWSGPALALLVGGSAAAAGLVAAVATFLVIRRTGREDFPRGPTGPNP